MENVNPRLIEPGIKYFLRKSLSNSHDYKVNYYNTIFNCALFLVFITIIIVVLYSKYKGKMSPNDVKLREKQTQEYVLEKIKKFQVSKRKMEQDLITGLPYWDNEYDLLHKKYG